MVRKFKYRTVSVILAGVFTVFSIGIPIVLASCPMMKSSKRGACCPIRNAEHKTILKKYQDYSCCKTVIAAERNKTEYLQNQTPVLSIVNQVAQLSFVSPSLLQGDNFSRIVFFSTHSPPSIQDIPIFTSSLLI